MNKGLTEEQLKEFLNWLGAQPIGNYCGLYWEIEEKIKELQTPAKIYVEYEALHKTLCDHMNKGDMGGFVGRFLIEIKSLGKTLEDLCKKD